METEETEDLTLISIRIADVTGQAGFEVQTAGVAESGLVYLRGDIHPLGSFAAMSRAAQQQVPYVAVTAVEVLFPAEWLRAECAGDMERMRIIDNAEAFVRSGR